MKAPVNLPTITRIDIIKCPPPTRFPTLFSPPSNLAAVEQGIQLVPPDDGERISHVVFNDRYHEEFFIHKVSFRPKVGSSNPTKLIRISPSDTQCIICLKYFKFSPFYFFRALVSEDRIFFYMCILFFTPYPLTYIDSFHLYLFDFPFIYRLYPRMVILVE